MKFTKTTAVAAALITAATLAAPFSAANAHGGKKHHHHFGHHPHGLIVIGTPGPSCGYWLHKYKKTGKQKFLNRYYACIL